LKEQLWLSDRCTATDSHPADLYSMPAYVSHRTLTKADRRRLETFEIWIWILEKNDEDQLDRQN